MSLLKYFQKKPKQDSLPPPVELNEMERAEARIGSAYTFSQVVLDILIEQQKARYRQKWWELWKPLSGEGITDKLVAAYLLNKSGILRDTGNQQKDIKAQLALFEQAESLSTLGNIYLGRVQQEQQGTNADKNNKGFFSRLFKK